MNEQVIPTGQEFWIPKTKIPHKTTPEARRVESRRFIGKPKNYLALQKAYQELVPLGSTREIGAVYLTNQKDRIALVYAACGDEKGVDLLPVQDELEYLFSTYRLNTAVTFHNHPDEYVTGFSETDRLTQTYQGYHLDGSFYLQSHPNRTLFLFNAVSTCADEYEWAGYSTKAVSIPVTPTHKK